MERPNILGHTTTIRDLGNEAGDAALCGARILLTGESGVGKQTLARLIHERTRGATAPLVVLDCCEIPDATFEAEWNDYHKVGTKQIFSFEEIGSNGALRGHL